MANSAQDADAAFFNLMHHFLATSNKGEADPFREPESERRGESRRAFRLTQRIAPGYCWEVPPETAWIEVHCHDLAQAGFSFFLDEMPTFERLVAMFRSAAPIYVAARITQCRQVAVDPWGGIIESSAVSAGGAASGRGTETKFLVGCTFLRRVSK